MLDIIVSERRQPIEVRCPKCKGRFYWHGSLETYCKNCAEHLFADELLTPKKKKRDGKKV